MKCGWEGDWEPPCKSGSGVCSVGNRNICRHVVASMANAAVRTWMRELLPKPLCEPSSCPAFVIGSNAARAAAEMEGNVTVYSAVP